MLEHYILDGKEPKKIDSLEEWAKWFEEAENRLIAVTNISPEITVSTIFLGLDHNWSKSGPPVLFETMVFGYEDGDLTERTSTWDEAKSAHDRIVKELMNDSNN